MAQTIVLIDPNDAAVGKLVDQVNDIRPGEVWVGCSVSDGKETAAVFDALTVPAHLFPGTIGQIRHCYARAEQVHIPDPLIYHNPFVEQVKAAAKTFIQIVGNPEKYVWMSYVLLHTHCTAAKIAGITIPPSDQEVLDRLASNGHPIIYVEGGSKDGVYTITQRMGLLEQIRKNFPGHLLIGEGISHPSQMRELSHLCDRIVLSNAVQQDPKSLQAYLR